MIFNATINDIAEIMMGQSPKGEECNDKGLGLPLLNGPTEFTSRSPIPVQFTEAGNKFAEPDDILFCVRGSTTGKMNYADQRYVIGRGIAAIRGKNGYPTPYVRAVIEQNLDLLLASATGSTFPNVSRDLLNNFEVNSVPLEDAREINKLILSLEYKIALNNQINQTLESISQAIFKSWFVDFEPVKAKIAANEAGEDAEGVTRAAMRTISGKTDDELDQMQAEQPEDYGQLKNTAELFPAAMQDSELGGVPEGWEVKQIQDLAKTIKGKSYKSAELAESKTALVTLKSFNRGGGYRLDGLKEYTGSHKAEQEVFAGDLIIAYTDVTQAADVIGKPAMVVSDSRYEHLVISLDVAVVRPEIDCHNYFLYGLAMTDTFQNHTKSYTTGTTVLHLGKSAVPEFQFSKPSEELLKLFEQNVSPMFTLVNEKIEDNRNMENLRDTLLPKLLSGELEVNAVNKAES